MKKYNFSVIVPCYNTGNTLQHTINSLLDQTLNDVQIIIIDDASTDELTRKKIELYQAQPNVTIVYLEENGGLSHARNTGLALATSDYILCLDSDDYIDATYLQKVKAIFDNDSQKKIGLVSPGVQEYGASTIQWIPRTDFTLTQLMSVNRIPGAASCVRKQVYDEIGNFDEQLKMYEDWDFWIRVFARGKWEMHVIPEFLFFYNVRHDSMMHALPEERMRESMQYILHKHHELYEGFSDEVLTELHVELMRSRIAYKNVHAQKQKSLAQHLVQIKKNIFPEKWL